VRPSERKGIIDGLCLDDILFVETGRDEWVPSEWLDFAGWSEFSGSGVDTRKAQTVLRQIEEDLIGLDASGAVRLSLQGSSPVLETDAKPCRSNVAGLKAVLFGYGSYPKSVIMPNLPKNISLTKVHEIDPCQIGPVDSFPFSSDSSAFPRPSEKFDVYLIAGFHHTHSPIAVHAVRNGAFAVVEKPVVTTFEQLEDLLEAMDQAPGRLFSGFHKRYSRLNKLAIEDLNVVPGEPISYHCIVHEVKLPAFHWYRWPNSRSRIVSNGCHWLDHFLFLNDFVPVRNYDVWQASNGDIFATAELSNGASFSMALTDHGSSRIGVQEHVELRAKDTTVCIGNRSHYFAENSRRVIRRCKVHKMEGHRNMYRAIWRSIATGIPGDSRESVERSCRLVLGLEEKLKLRRSESAVAMGSAGLKSRS